MKMFNKILVVSAFFVTTFAISVHGKNLVPDEPGDSGDYFITWELQGYVCSYKSQLQQRKEMNEANMFGPGKHQGWLNMFESIREDMYFVMGDSWDIPPDGDPLKSGSLILNERKFPSYPGDPEARLKKLADDVKAKGWKGLGCWIPAQNAPEYGGVDRKRYWTERLGWLRDAGIEYVSIGLGQNAGDPDWREFITDLARKIAPNLTIEHSSLNMAMTFSDVYKTNQTERIVSTAQTINQVSMLLKQFERDMESKADGIINCTDEPYIAAGLGCAIAMSRHQFTGNLPSGRNDLSFPAVGHDQKNRMDEVIRAVRWHRLAPPFGLDAQKNYIDIARHRDRWFLYKDEAWVFPGGGNALETDAPARVTRGLPLPEVTARFGGPKPFVMASRYPNGAVAIATQPRIKDRKIIFTPAEIRLRVGKLTGPIGIFGRYEKLILKFDRWLDNSTIYAQDLAGIEAVDITSRVKIEGTRLIIPGDVIDEIGLAAATEGDKSDPGMVLVIE